jgi:hypothetical protein
LSVGLAAGIAAGGCARYLLTRSILAFQMEGRLRVELMPVSFDSPTARSSASDNANS